MIREWKALRAMGRAGSSATIPTNSPAERLEIVDAGMDQDRVSILHQDIGGMAWIIPAQADDLGLIADG